ncbi:MAG: hypothetical protein HY343_00505 [Lentisphaerae bacterium]|nr:hypothetical protein [Lentisphaerota bacterium]
MPSTLHDIGDRKQLFIDNRWFAASQGIRLAVNPPVKARQVLTPDKPWESYGLNFATALAHDGKVHLWYDAIAAGYDKQHQHRMGTAYCVSDDGIHFERPALNLFEWEGIRENNIVMPGGCGTSVMLDPNGPDEHRFKALSMLGDTPMWSETRGSINHQTPGFYETYLLTSPDGIHWKRQPFPASVIHHDSQNHFFFDRRLKKYVAYLRINTVGVDGVGWRQVARTEFDDPLQTPWPFQRNPNSKKGPGHSLQQAGGEFPLALGPDAYDPVETDLYTPCVHQYPWADDSYYLAFPAQYRHFSEGRSAALEKSNDGLVDVQLATSADGVLFDRPDRRPYVSLGLDDAWDRGALYMQLGMIRRGNEIDQYTLGMRHTHGDCDISKPQCDDSIGRVTQRLDGFMSAAADYAGATFTTPLIRFSGRELRLNADCSAQGQIWVEIRDERNLPIWGYTYPECIAVDGNRTDALVRWKDHDNVGALAGRPLRFYFKLRACKLYAFQFVK